MVRRKELREQASGVEKYIDTYYLTLMFHQKPLAGGIERISTALCS